MSIEQIKRSCLSINQQWNQCSNRGSSTPKTGLLFDYWSYLVLEHRSSISRIPNEVLLKLFRFYLSPFDLLRSCLTVNRRWFNLVRNKSLWTRVNPIDWSRGSTTDLLNERDTSLSLFSDQCSNKNPAELSFASNDVQLETMVNTPTESFAYLSFNERFWFSFRNNDKPTFSPDFKTIFFRPTVITSKNWIFTAAWRWPTTKLAFSSLSVRT